MGVTGNIYWAFSKSQTLCPAVCRIIPVQVICKVGALVLTLQLKKGRGHVSANAKLGCASPPPQLCHCISLVDNAV